MKIKMNDVTMNNQINNALNVPNGSSLRKVADSYLNRSKLEDLIIQVADKHGMIPVVAINMAKSVVRRFPLQTEERKELIKDTLYVTFQTRMSKEEVDVLLSGILEERSPNYLELTFENVERELVAIRTINALLI